MAISLKPQPESYVRNDLSVEYVYYVRHQSRNLLKRDNLIALFQSQRCPFGCALEHTRPPTFCIKRED